MRGRKTSVPAGIVALGIVVFWVGVAAAASRIPGYRPQRGTISALAADERSRPVVWGASTAFAVAHAAAAVGLFRARLRPAAVLLGAATVAGLLVAWLPIDCPHGAAGCSGPLAGRPHGAMAVAHRDATAVYVVLFSLTLLCAGIQLLRRSSRGALLIALAFATSGLAWGLRQGVQLGLWERMWLGMNSLSLICLVATPSPSGVSGHQRRWIPRNAGRSCAVGGGLVAVAVAPWAAALQPAYSWQHDLASNLAARGAHLPALGRVVIAAVAVAYLGATRSLARLRRWTTAALAAVAAAGTAGVAAVPMGCPRGAHGCSGPNSGRQWPRPPSDVVHRDLVVALEAGSVLMLLGVAVLCWRAGQHASAAGSAALAVASVVLLGGQQAGHNIGFWQLSWLAVTLTAPVLAAGLRGHPLPQPGQGAAENA